jgi:1-deoxy-D-xylulose-5-phosphate reductoisomerase
MGVRTVSLVGSTGSIGTQAAEVVAHEPDRFKVVALAAPRPVEALADQARRWRPELVAIGDPSLAAELARQVPAGTEVMSGP